MSDKMRLGSKRGSGAYGSGTFDWRQFPSGVLIKMLKLRTFESRKASISFRKGCASKYRHSLNSFIDKSFKNSALRSAQSGYQYSVRRP